MSTIFYSWQSDLSSRTNRGLIEHALESAVKTLRSDDTIVPAVRGKMSVDKDTRGMAGSPDITATIFEKISMADVCVFDVSIVISAIEGREPTEAIRRSPNPNVLIELGYALGTKGPERVIAIFNAAYGTLKDLPFDLRGRRILQYTATDDATELARIRSELTQDLVRALKLTYDHLHAHRFSKTDQRFCADLLESATYFLDSIAERQYRRVGPEAQQFLENAAAIARNLRRLAAQDTAHGMGLVERLQRAGSSLEELAHVQRTLGDGGAIEKRARSVADEVAALCPECIPAERARLSDHDYKADTRDVVRQALHDITRFEALLLECRMPALNDARSSMATIGTAMLRLSHALEVIGAPEHEVLRTTAYGLRAAGYRGTAEAGFEPERRLLVSLRALRPGLGRIES